MSYVSPIKINDVKVLPDPDEQANNYAKYIAGEVDSLVLREVHKVSCDVDERELIRALRYDRGQYEKGYRDGKFAAAGWRSVADEIPSSRDEFGSGEYVLATDGVVVTRAFYGAVGGHDEWFVNAGEQWTATFGTDVTHWMPLPEPPGTGGKA